MMKVSMRVVLILLVFAGSIGLYTPSYAQDKTITLSLAVPSGMKDLVTSKLAKDYESANPGIKINVVDQLGVPWAADGLPAHFNALQQYANAADVLYLTVSRISPEATRAGYLLDLTPFVSTDKSINVDDFYPSIWQSFQWDNGIWALPSSAQMWVLNYDPAAFDKAGLTYPTDNWTLDDFATAARKLTIKDASGNVVIPGFAPSTDYSTLMLFRSLLGANLFDPSSIPNPPQFNTPGLETLLDTWFKLQQEGVIGQSAATLANSLPPMTVTFAQVTGASGSHPRAGALLPGGKAGLDTRAFAVSGGSLYPDQAYALSKWLTTRGDIPYSYGHIPARKSLVNFQPDTPSPQHNLLPETQALIARGFANPITIADMRYVDYLRLALTKMKTQNLDAKAAWQAAESQAVSDVQTALDNKGKLALVVATPPPLKALTPGKIALNFDVYSLAQPLPNKAGWDALIQSFTATDPLVEQVIMSSTRSTLDQAVTTSDCFYLPANAVPGAPLASLLNIDPLLAADSTFDSADMIGNVMASVQRDNKTWALPIVISPTILQYDASRLTRVGASNPSDGWQVDTFVDMLKLLKADGTGTPPFATAGQDDTPLLILMADYGGLPLDYRTDPPTINFTDPTTVAAIRQVLDLVKQGYIQYVPRGNSITPDLGSADHNAPIYPDAINALGGFPQSTAASAYKPALYPKGSKFNGIGYTLGAAYISAQAKNPEACYRFISALAKHPELFMAMPARRSQLSNAQFKASTNPDVLALYTQIDALLKEPNTVDFPVPNQLTTPVSDFLLRYWLYQAFDGYVLKGSDLDSALKDAESYAKGFQQCAVNLPPVGVAALNNVNTLLPYVTCAEKADARLKPILDPLLH